jgi:hypothetical protein
MAVLCAGGGAASPREVRSQKLEVRSQGWYRLRRWLVFILVEKLWGISVAKYCLMWENDGTSGAHGKYKITDYAD